MQTIEFPRSAWPKALNDFSASHEGWPISVDVLAADIGAQPEVHDLPLVGVVAEDREGGTIVVSAAKQFDHISHIIHAPSRVWVERTDEGADVALQIESADGTTIVRIGTPAPPDTAKGRGKE